MSPPPLLLHFSPRPVRFRRDYQYPWRHSSSWDWKPRGLWVSVPGPDDWQSQSDPSAVAFAYRVVLSTSARLLVIDTLAAFDAFDRAMAGIPPSETDRASPLRRLAGDGPSAICRASGPPTSLVDWAQLEPHYDGIVIAPHRWERVSEDQARSWYDAWDCGSGCIWRLSAIERLAPLG